MTESLPINHPIKQMIKNILIMPLAIKQPLSQNIEAKKHYVEYQSSI
jgi:hypothetical protein